MCGVFSGEARGRLGDAERGVPVREIVRNVCEEAGWSGTGMRREACRLFPARKGCGRWVAAWVFECVHD